MITRNQVFKGANAHPLEVLAGGGTANNNATGEAAGFTNLVDLCVTHAKIFVADAHTVRCISFGGVVTTFAGSNTATGHVDAIGESARFHNIGALDYDKSLQVLVCADTNNHRIRSISMTGQVATIAGTGKAELKDGLGTAASFNYPKGIITYQRWNFVADTHNNALRCISPDGLVTTIAGGTAQGYRDAFGTQALLSHPTSICHDSGGRFYFVDSGSKRVRTFTADVSEKIPLSPSDMPKLLASLCDKETGGNNDLVFSIKKSNGEKVFAVCSIVQARSSSLVLSFPPPPSLSLSLSPSLSLYRLSISLPLALCISLSLCLSHTHTFSVSVSLSVSFSLSPYLSLLLFPSFSFSPSLSLSLSLSLFLSLSLSLSLSHTHTHTLSFFLSLLMSECMSR